MTRIRQRGLRIVALLAMGSACSADNAGNANGTGGRAGQGSDGASTTGGRPGSGGVVASGGAIGGASGTGGVFGTGGATVGSGGASAAGGTNASGGRSGTGGASRSGGATGGRDAGRAGGSTGSGGAIQTGGTTGVGGQATTGPCDIYETGSTPCVAAHSTIRALYGSFSGKLYQVRRTDNTTKDILTLAPGGFADAAAQDSFCAGSTCVITFIYDQSGKGNHLEYQGSGSSVGGQDKPSTATKESLSVGGHKVYSLYIDPGNSYWRDGHTTGVPTGSSPEGIYMVTSGSHVNDGCCFDYGNSETTRSADGAGAMDAIYFGTSCWFKNCPSSVGRGPWVQADLEYGLYPGGSNAASAWDKQKSFASKYVTAMLKNNGTTKFALKGGDAQSGSLTTVYDGALPSGYNPMKKQGSIILGSGGDCCKTNTNMSLGTFYEGAMVAGYPSDATDDSIQKNIVAAGYGAAAALAAATSYDTSTATSPP
jgi:hypothetical protein